MTEINRRAIPEEQIFRKAGICPGCAVALCHEANAVLRRWAAEEATEGRGVSL